MRAEVVEESRAWTRNLAPSVADVGTIPIDARFEFDNASDEIATHRVLDGEEIAVPASVLEHGEQDVLLLRDSSEMSCFLDGDSERLVDDDIATGIHRRFSEWRVRFIGARNYNELDIRMRRGECLRIGDNIDIRNNCCHIPGT